MYKQVRQLWFHFARLLSTGFVNQFVIPVLHLRDQQCHLQTQEEWWPQRETSVPWEDGGWISMWGWKPSTPFLNLKHLGQNPSLRLQVWVETQKHFYYLFLIWIFLPAVSERPWLEVCLNRLILTCFYSLRPNSSENNSWDLRDVTHSPRPQFAFKSHLISPI